jgi:TPR repeat protein
MSYKNSIFIPLGLDFLRAFKQCMATKKTTRLCLFGMVVAVAAECSWAGSSNGMINILRSGSAASANERANYRSMLKKKCGYTAAELNDMHLSNKEMLALLAQGCQRPQAQGTLSGGYSSYSVPQKALQPTELEIIESAALAGNADAQVKLGSLYRGMRNELIATQWFSKAAMQGHPKAQLFLGYRYLYGIGAPKDPAAATTWLYKAAEQGEWAAYDAIRTMKFSAR